MERSEELRELRSFYTTLAYVLLNATVACNIVEGVVSVYWGVSDDTLSLFGFGIDSFIEVASAMVILFHLMIEFSSEKKEHISQLKAFLSIERERKITLTIGSLLSLFGISVIVSSIVRLVQEVKPSSTLPGIVISLASLSVMSVLFYFKTKAAVILNSSALTSEANCTLSCMKLSCILLIGSIVYVFSNRLWWVDAVTAICIGLRVGYEGILTVKECLKEDFDGGCGCCSGSDSYLAKYWRKTLQQKYNMEAKKNASKKSANTCTNACGKNCENDQMNCQVKQTSTCGKKEKCGCDETKKLCDKGADGSTVEIAKETPKIENPEPQTVEIQIEKGKSKQCCQKGCCKNEAERTKLLDQTLDKESVK